MTITTFILANVYLALWLLLYYVVFRKRITFLQNRIMLLGGIVLAFLLPFITLPFYNWFSTPTATSIITTTAVPGEIISEFGEDSSWTFPWWNSVLWIYRIGVAFMGFMFFKKLFIIWRLIQKFPNVNGNAFIHVQTPQYWDVFSFMEYVFAPVNTPESIIAHEKVHIKQRHSIDIMVVEIVKIFCWFNPAIYMYQKAIKMVHEYLADAATIKTIDIKEYAQKLVNQSFKFNNLSLVQPFFINSQIQNRLIMLQKSKNSSKSKWIYLLLIPMCLGMVFLSTSFSIKDKLQRTIDRIKPVQEEAGMALQDHAIAVQDSDKVYTTVEQMPEFPGGREAMYKYLSESLKYPEKAKEKGIKGAVYASFIIDTEGEISHIKILRGLTPEMNHEVIRVIGAMSKWTPGEQDGKKVNVKMVLPVMFQLDSNKEAPKTPPVPEAPASPKKLRTDKEATIPASSPKERG